MEKENERSFLGRGWAFPPEFHAGIASTVMVSEEEEIRQSLCILLATRLGERTMRPDFGSGLDRLVHHNMDLTARTRLQSEIERAVLYFESRITLNSIRFDVCQEEEGVLTILFEYTIRLTNTRSNLVYPYYYDEHR